MLHPSSGRISISPLSFAEHRVLGSLRGGAGRGGRVVPRERASPWSWRQRGRFNEMSIFCSRKTDDSHENKKSPCSRSNSIPHFPWTNRVNNGKWAAICFAMAKWAKKRGIKTCLMNGSATLKRSICFLSRPLIYVSENSIASAPLPLPSFSASLAGNEGPRRPRRLVCDSGLPGCQGTSYGTRSCVNQRKKNREYL